MDLKAVLEKRKAQKDNSAQGQGQTWVKKGELEKQREDEYLKKQEEIEKRKQEKIFSRIKEQDDYYSSVTKKLKILGDDVPTKENQESLKAAKEKDAENETGEPPVMKSEVIRRLRAMGVPITFFGESDWVRYKRMLKCEEENIDQGMKEGGNYFKTDLNMNEEEFHNKFKEKEEDLILLEKLKERIFDPEAMNSQDKKNNRKLTLSKGVNHSSKCEDVYIWCKKVLTDWENMLQKKTEEEKNGIEGKQEIGMYRQCVRYLKPMFNILKDKTISEEILDALYHIAHYCILKEYVKAHDKYLEVAIGNSPWPMGVTMVGIHERSGRAKIFSSQVAHILNDDTQRKYLQVIKRLITISQKISPHEDLTKCVSL